MVWSRLAGLAAAVLVAMSSLAAAGQLGISLFDHGGMLPTFVLIVAFVVIVSRLGTRAEGRAATPYW